MSRAIEAISDTCRSPGSSFNVQYLFLLGGYAIQDGEGDDDDDSDGHGVGEGDNDGDGDIDGDDDNDDDK